MEPSAARPSLRLRRGHVLRVDAERAGATEITVEVDGEAAAAVAYSDLVGVPLEGDRVLLNTTAVALGLGTGGAHLVVSIDRVDETELTHGGRVMKARYTPHQVAVRAVEETHRDVLDRSVGLGGAPVVAAPLHSMIAPIAAGARTAGARRIVYVMTDGAALPGPLSRLVPELVAAGLIDAWVTAGQAFGGDAEAATVWSAMLAAREVYGAEIVVVADGPGNLGTDTTWGVTALRSGDSLNAAATLGGRPVAALRISLADERERHRGVSHHSLTILERVASPGVHVAVPALEDPERTLVWDALRARALEERHQLVEVDGRPALAELERREVAASSMGRGLGDDPAFFLAAGAAGVLAARMAAASARWHAER